MEVHDKYRDLIGKALAADALADAAWDRGDTMAARHHMRGAADLREQAQDLCDEMPTDAVILKSGNVYRL